MHLFSPNKDMCPLDRIGHLSIYKSNNVNQMACNGKIIRYCKNDCNNTMIEHLTFSYPLLQLEAYFLPGSWSLVSFEGQVPVQANLLRRETHSESAIALWLFFEDIISNNQSSNFN